MTSDATVANCQADDAPPTPSKTTDAERALFAEVVTINRPAKDLYHFWRNIANLPALMDNVLAIEVVDGLCSRWTVKAPAGREVAGTHVSQSALQA